MTRAEVGQKLGCHANTVFRYEQNRVPQSDMLAKIFDLTDGAVTPNDFHEFCADEDSQQSDAA